MKNKKIIIGLIVVLIITIMIIMKLQKIEETENTGTTIIEGKILTSTQNNESVITEEGTVILSDDIIKKIGDTDNLEASDKEGKNSAILINKQTDAKITDLEIRTDGTGASGISVTNTQAKANINNTNITTTGERSKGILVSQLGQVTANNVNIKTLGYKSSAVVTDIRGGDIKVSNSTLETNNVDSAGIYSTGNIEAENVTIKTKQAEGAVIDGAGVINLKNVDITSYKKRGVMIYYTGPKVRESTIGRFYMTEGSLDVKEGPAFYVTNTIAEIEIDNAKITTSSGILLKASIDEYNELGQEKAVEETKGGEITLTARNQILEGDVLVDNQSSAMVILEDSCTFKGKINTDNTGKIVSLQTGTNVIIELTGDSYVTDLALESGTKIITNGYNIYYTNETNLEGVTIEGTGKLVKK